MRGLASALVALHLACTSTARSSPSEEVRRATVNDGAIAYAVDGSGQPLVIIHGAWGDLRSFSRAAPELAKRMAVVRVSLRYHWPNAAPKSESDALELYRVETHAADVVALIEHLGRGPAVVVGHSYGGIVAALVAQSRPDLVTKLVLVEPSLYGVLREHPEVAKYIAAEQAWAERKLALTREGQDPLEVAHVIFDETRPGTFASFPEARRTIFLANSQTVRPILIHNWSQVPYACAEARRIRMPVLLVEGERTDDDMREIGSRLVACIPDARRVILPGASHIIQFDAPEAMAREVARFLAH